MNPEIVVITISLLLILTISSMALFQFASAFVNIISPSKGEAVPAGSGITVSGTSDDNAQTNCKVQIIVNGHRPYQDTIPVAPGDYSEWTFVVSPQYAEIEEGINTITSKASCDIPHEPVLKLDPLTRQYVKHYGINVTGVPAGVQGGVDSDPLPPVVPSPGEDEFEGEEDEDEDSTSVGSLFG
jgi:hypothetical protein